MSDVADCAVSSLREHLGDNLVAVVLYGSRARGDAQAGSDWDLLVLARGLPQGYLARHLAMKRALAPECRGAVSLLTKTPEEFEANLSALYLDIALDGRILYDPTGYAARKLQHLRDLLVQRRGLYRERTPAGDVWRWRERPGGAWRLTWEP